MMESEIRGARILLIDSNRSTLGEMTRILAAAGFHKVDSRPEPMEAIREFRALAPDLVAVDLHLHGVDGFQCMKAIRAMVPPGTYLPIVATASRLSQDEKGQALATGATDFLGKPFDPAEVEVRIRNLLETRTLHQTLAHQNMNLESRIRARAKALSQARTDMLKRLFLASEYRDNITGRHAERVGVLSGLIAKEAGLPQDEVELIRRAAPLHDVGKIGIPDTILFKPGRLTSAEYEVMKTHTVIGGRLLSGGRFPLLRVAKKIALSHHERWNGGGYPEGLRKDQIPLEGRITAVADAFDCLTHERAYKSASSFSDAADEIMAGRNTSFDPSIVDVFERVVSSPSIPQELGVVA